MTNKFLLAAGDVYKIPETSGMKAITTIPGWAEAFNKKRKSVPAATRYMRSPTAYTCVQMRARAISGIPWKIQTGKESFAPDNNPLVTLLNEVNDDMNWVDLIRATESDMLIHKAAYWLKGKADSGGPTRFLWRLNPAEIEVVTDKDGIVAFKRGIESKKPETYAREDVIYFHDYHPIDDYCGLAPIDVARDAIDMEIQSSQYINAFFDNYAVPPIVFETDATLVQSEYSKLRAWFRRTFSGAQNQHKAAFMDNGLKAKVIGYPLKDLALKEVREEARRDICAAFGVPPAIAGAWEAANFATAREQHRSFYEDIVIPRADYFASVINSELVNEYGSGLKFTWIFDELPIMQNDRLQEAQRAGILVRDGVIKPGVAAVEMGYQESDAGIGPVQTRIVDDQQNDVTVNKSNLSLDLNKWQRKVENRLATGKGAQVDFESELIPSSVNQVIYNKLAACKTKEQVAEVFGGFYYD